MTDTPVPATENLGTSQNTTPESPNVIPGWQKCLACSDYGVSCNGPSLGSLGNIASVRSFHKAMKKARKLTLKPIAEAAPTISENTINEYFSNVIKDYKWTTVSAIDNAMACICGNRVGGMPLDNTCPASSSELRNQLAAADLKLAAAELSLASAQAECDDLRRKLADSDGSHLLQLAEVQQARNNSEEWLKDDVRMWRRFAFILLGVGLVLLSCLLLYIALDIMNPASGFVRY